MTHRRSVRREPRVAVIAAPDGAGHGSAALADSTRGMKPAILLGAFVGLRVAEEIAALRHERRRLSSRHRDTGDPVSEPALEDRRVEGIDPDTA